MAVVRNLMIRIGADYSAARQAMQGATRELGRFKQTTQKTVDDISGRRGFGAVSTQLRDLSRSVSASISQIRGAKGIGGVVMALGELRPALSSATTGLRGFGAAAGAAGASAGVAGLAIAGLTAAIAAAVYALYRVSQPAVQFEADLMRLNMQLRGSSREFMNWARAQGLAASTAANMGATYGTLLSSFIADTRELGRQTQNLVHATRVVASATGRTIEDVTERMRSGLLGNTEAIEDLGIFVNVSMIESTDAFKRFADGRHWDELDFRVQQQIRLAAILEQAYARYGNELQQNVMTKQTLLTEQLKDIKLNLSQAFLPIWDVVLPALIRLAEALAYVTEQLARFIYWLRGWDYDERTRGTNEMADAIRDEGGAYDDLADSARAARKELAAFDRLNLIGGNGAGGTGGTGGGTGGTHTPPGGRPGEGPELPPLPPVPKLQLQFDTPSPPDAGIGAVATAVVATMDALTAQIRAKWQQALENMRAGVVTAAPTIVSAWQVMLSGVVVAIQSAMSQTQMTWQTALSGMMERIGVIRPSIVSEWGLIQSAAKLTIPVMGEVAAAWAQKLAEMLARLKAARPQFESDWYLIRYAARLTVTTVGDVAVAWGQKLGEMLSNLKVARPQFESELWAIRYAVRLVIPAVTDTKDAWSAAMQAMVSAAASAAANIASAINGAITAINNLRSAMELPKINLPSVSIPQPVQDYFSRTFSRENAQETWDRFVENVKGIPTSLESQLALTLLGGGAVKGGQAAMKGLAELLKRVGIAVPAFAAGGVVSGPTLAMVGEYPGARTNPEVIAPLSDLESMMDSSRTNDLLARILRAVERGQNVTVSISRNEVGQAVASYINDEARRGRNPLPAL